MTGPWRCVVPMFRGGTVLVSVAACVVLGFVAPGSAQPQPGRIISLIPAVTEMLFAIGAGDQVVGVSSFDTYPPAVASRAAVGGLFDPNYERILSLRPDLVIAYGSQDELVARLRTTGTPTMLYRHGGLAQITETIRELGRRIGRTGAADGLADSITAELDRVEQSVAGRARPKTLLVFGREDGSLRGLFVSGGTGFLHDVLTLAGADNVMGDIDREGLQLSAELLLARAPEVVVELRGGDGWSPERRERELAVWRAARIPAARTGRVHLLTDGALVIPGPRVVEAARTLAGVIHPGAGR